MAKIGLDFGTSYTTVSYLDAKTGVPTPVRINGKEKIPTMLFFPDDGDKPLFGEAAFNVYRRCLKIKNVERASEILAGLFSDLKKNMNQTEKLYLPDNSEISYAEMIGKFLHYLKEEIESTTFQGESITDICITYPVKFEEYKKNILREAATLAGFSTVKLLMEPVAAAMGYQEKQDNCKNKSILVYDFGGGTFDLAFVKFDNNGDHITLPPMGDLHCGGQDIDLEIYKEWDKLVFSESRGTQHIADEEGLVDAPFLKTVCMDNKEQLSVYFKEEGRVKKVLDEDVAGDYREITITREQWEGLVSPFIDKTITLTKQMIKKVKEENYSIDNIILIGGSSRISLIYDRLNEISEISGKVSRVADIDVAVANGAAIFVNQGKIEPKRCYCIRDGKELNTAMKYCTECGKPNFKYDFRLADQL